MRPKPCRYCQGIKAVNFRYQTTDGNLIRMEVAACPLCVEPT